MGIYSNRYIPGISHYPGLDRSEVSFRTSDHEGFIRFQSGRFTFHLTESSTDEAINLDFGLPNQVGHSGEFLTTNGASSSWVAIDHAADRDRANHTGTQVASTISDFDTEVSNNATVVTNTAKVSYTDAAKVAGIEAGADVTDSTNVAAAGAIMDSDFTAIGFMIRTGASTYSVTLVRKATEALTSGLNNLTFSSTIGSTSYILLLYCYDASGNTVDFQVTSRVATGFSITVPINCSLDYKAEII